MTKTDNGETTKDPSQSSGQAPDAEAAPSNGLVYGVVIAAAGLVLLVGTLVRRKSSTDEG